MANGLDATSVDEALLWFIDEVWVGDDGLAECYINSYDCAEVVINWWRLARVAEMNSYASRTTSVFVVPSGSA